MTRALLVVATLAASSGIATAGAYVGVGIGPRLALSADAAAEATPQGRTGRLLVGYRFANVSIEGALAGVGTSTDHGDDHLLTAWAAGKLSFPLSSGFEAFGRAGLQRTWAEIDQGPVFEISGNGILLGGGFEYRLNMVAAKASIWVDYTLQRSTLTDTKDVYGLEYGGTLRTWTLGVSIGL